MYSVSEAYKTQIKQALRNPSYVKIQFSVIDPDALGDSSLSDDGAVYWSNSTDVAGSFDVTESYMTLEHNRLVLDGTNPLPLKSDEGPFSYQGYIGDEISGSDGVFVSPNTLTVDFLTTYFSFIGLTLNFDTIMGDYPAQLQLKAWSDTTLVYDETKTVDQVENWYGRILSLPAIR